jgi:hypothetical protein
MVGDVDSDRWAAAHYRVERVSRGSGLNGRRRRRARGSSGDPDPFPDVEPSDVLRLYDRSGRVVFERDWGSDRAGAGAQEARIVEDLLHLDIVAFRFRYDIEDPALRGDRSPGEPSEEAGAEPDDARSEREPGGAL